MSQPMYHQLNPLIRLKENELLTPEVFQQLIEASDFKQLEAILAGTVYGTYLEENFAKNFEKSLNQELLTTFSQLAEAAPNPDLIWIYTMRYTFHNLKVLTKAYYTKNNYDELYLPDGIYSAEELKGAVETGKSSVLPQSLLKSILEVREYMAESNIMQGIDVIYDRQFLTEQRRLADELDYPALTKEIISFIDLTNLTTALRCLEQKRTQGFMSTVLSSSGSIPKDTLMSFAEKGLPAFIDFLLASNYGDLLAPVFEGEEIDYARLDLLKDDYLSSLFDGAQTIAFGPLPLLAFLNNKDIEVKNLRLILVGKRSGFTKEQIKERMRMTYGL